MVGIVVVSHSRALARAAVALAEQMLQGRHVPIAVAAGLDDETFGTDAVRIAEAIAEADQDGDGVVVLMDLGSAVLSAELALELLKDEAARERVLLCPAPLVEGLIVAAVTALSGTGRAEIAAEAVAALAAKQAQLAPPTSTSSPAAPSAPLAAPPPSSPLPHRVPGATDPPVQQSPGVSDPEVFLGQFTVATEHGLHARPAARLVQLLQGVDAQVELRNLTTGSGWVRGASLSRLTTLGALRGHQVEIRAAGPEAGRAVAQVLALDFAETPAEQGKPASGPGPDRDRTGPQAASPGIGIGPAVLLNSTRPPTSAPPRDAATGDLTAGDPTATGSTATGSTATDGAGEGRQRLDAAIDAVRVQLQQIRAHAVAEVGEAEAAIFDAHLALLADPELLEPARARIATGQGANSAWASAVSIAAAGYESLTDPYLRGRAADVRALGNQVSLHLMEPGGRHPDQPEERSGVLVAGDLTPAEAAMLDADRVVAVVLAYGSPTAHSTILIRARGIPAVVGAGPEVLEIADGTPLAVDGTTGELAIDASDAVLAGFRDRARSRQRRARAALALADGLAVTRDGVEVLVGANIGSLAEARAAAVHGADLVGLVRTEFLFLGRSQAPGVDEQEAAYRGLAEAVEGRRITFRTLDVGGDKPLGYLPLPAEKNPFLGVRGIRLALRRPELLADQLLAIVRVAHDAPVSVLLPMVSTLDELARARAALDDAIRRDGRGEPAGLRIGVMIEVPAAALKSEAFAAQVDFLSIGTNDLTQYTLAAERGNQAVATLGDALDPAVLRLIDATCRGAGPDTAVAVCGDLAANERAVGLLVGLGVRELSVTPRAVPGAKQAVRALDRAEARTLARRALASSSAAQVRRLLPQDL